MKKILIDQHFMIIYSGIIKTMHSNLQLFQISQNKLETLGQNMYIGDAPERKDYLQKTWVPIAYKCIFLSASNQAGGTEKRRGKIVTLFYYGVAIV